MKAGVLRGVGEPVRYEEVPKPDAEPGWAIVKLEYAALNHRDVWIRKGQYAGLKFPIIPGSDGSGTVESGEGEGIDAWIGKPAIIDAALGWGSREAAQDLTGFSILGLPMDGTFAEYVKVPIENLAERPDHLDAKSASALPLAGLTAYRALFSRGKLEAAQRVLITGAGGGVAAFSVEMAVAAGAEAWVSSSSKAKIETAVGLGAKGGANYREEGWSKDLKGRAGEFDLIIDGAGGADYGNLLDLARPGGTIVSYGATTGNVPSLELRRLFWKQLNLCGSTMGSPRDFQAMTEFVGRHRIVPHVDREFSLEQANDALDWMEQSQQMGKIVLRIG